MVLPQVELVGIYNLQLSATHNKVTRNRKVTMFEIELPLENGGVAYINSDATPITPNLVICAKPGQIRHTKYPFRCLYIHCILKEGYLYDTLMDFPNFISIQNGSVYRELFEKLRKHFEARTKQDEIMLQSLMLELIYLLSKEIRMKSQRGSSRGNHFDIDNALRYIKENLTEDLSLQSISKKMLLSPIHFHNRFKASVGQTLHDYVEERRIKAAINLLLTTELTLTQIAFQCGFSSQSYFSYVFKRKMGVSPRKYVEQVNKQYEGAL